MPTFAFDDTSEYTLTVEVTTADGLKRVTFDAEDYDREHARIAKEAEGDGEKYLAAMLAYGEKLGLAGVKWPTLFRIRDAVKEHLKGMLGKGPARSSGPPA